jgi:hypothetical protein
MPAATEQMFCLHLAPSLDQLLESIVDAVARYWDFPGPGNMVSLTGNLGNFVIQSTPSGSP